MGKQIIGGVSNEVGEDQNKTGVFNMTCDKVDAKVRVLENGEWEIIEILGRHEQAYERKKVYE